MVPDDSTPACASSQHSSRTPAAVLWVYLAWFLPVFIPPLFAPGTSGRLLFDHLVIPVYYLVTVIFLTRYWYRFTWNEVGIPGYNPGTEVIISIPVAALYLLIALAATGPSPSEAVGNLLCLWRKSKLTFAESLFFTPIVEELFFRGVAFRVFARRYNVNRAILVTSLLFALAHLSFSEFPIHFVTGLLFAYLVQDPESSLFPIMIYHMTLNLQFIMSR